MSSLIEPAKEGSINEILLIIEDDESLNALIQKSLGRAGFQTEGALTGEEGVMKAAEGNAALILLDYELPDMKGSLLVESLRDRNIDVPFIIVTGHGDEKVAVDMMKLGARDYLVKDKGFMDMLPFVIKKVMKEIKREQKFADTEKKIMQAAKEWKTTFDSIGDFVAVLDKDFRVRKANRSFIDLLGMDASDIIGKKCYDLLKGSNNSESDSPHAEMLNTRQTVTRDLYNQDLDRHLMVSISPIIDVDGAITSSVHYMKDITPLKKSEVELKKRVDDLEKFYEMAVNREVRMKELKMELKRVQNELASRGL